MPTAWSIGSSFVRRPAPRCTAALPTPIAPSCVDVARAAGASTSRTTGAVGSADSSAVPPCASIQRRQAPRPSRRRPPPRHAAGPPASSIPRSESASRRAQASRTSSVKSAGPWPRTVSSASRTSSALPTAAPERLVHVGEQAHDLAARLRGRATSIVSASVRASSIVFMKAPSPTFTSSTIAWAPAGELLRHDRRRDQRQLVDGRGHVAEAVEQLVGGHEVAGLADDRDPDVADLRDELVEATARSEKPGIDSSLSSVPPV